MIILNEYDVRGEVGVYGRRVILRCGCHQADPLVRTEKDATMDNRPRPWHGMRATALAVVDRNVGSIPTDREGRRIANDTTGFPVYYSFFLFVFILILFFSLFH